MISIQDFPFQIDLTGLISTGNTWLIAFGIVVNLFAFYLTYRFSIYKISRKYKIELQKLTLGDDDYLKRIAEESYKYFRKDIDDLKKDNNEQREKLEQADEIENNLIKEVSKLNERVRNSEQKAIKAEQKAIKAEEKAKIYRDKLVVICTQLDKANIEISNLSKELNKLKSMLSEFGDIMYNDEKWQSFIEDYKRFKQLQKSNK